MPNLPSPFAHARLSRRTALGSATATAAARVLPARAAPSGREGAPYAKLLSDWACEAYWRGEDCPPHVAPDPDGSIWTLSHGAMLTQYATDGTRLAGWSGGIDVYNDHHLAGGLVVGPDGTVHISLSYEEGILHFSRSGELLGATWSHLPAPPPAKPVVIDVHELDETDATHTSSSKIVRQIGDWVTRDWDPRLLLDDRRPPDFDVNLFVLARDGTYFVDGGHGEVAHLAADGELLEVWWAYEYRGGLHDLALGPDDSIWTVNAALCQVRRFSPAGDLLASWGSYGDAPGQLDDPASLAVAANGSVLVADLGNRRVHHFAPDGTFLGCLGDGDVAAARLVRPATVHASADGTVFVIDHEPHRTLRFALA